MAYNLKYRCHFTDFKNKRKSRVEIFKKDYSGDIIELKGAANPFSRQFNEAEWVIGSEAIFRFITTQSKTSDLDADFLESAYKDLKLKYYPDGTNCEFTGWVKPENTEREFHTKNPVYQISATDAISDLKNISYDNSGTVWTDSVSILTSIKRALNLTGITDNDFFIQCNTYETVQMTYDQNLFKEIDHDSRRFYSVEDGEIIPMKAYDVLIECIKNYNCKLFQDEGYWKIVNDQEPDSYRVIYNWSDLSVKSARAQNNRIVDINHLKPYGTDWPLSKIAPVKRLRITFRNKNLGDNEILNGDFSSGNPPDNWTNYGWDSFTNPGGYAKTTETSTNYDTKYIESDPFTLSGVSDEDQLEISFDAKLKSITFSTGNWYPNVYAALVDPDGGVSYGRQYVISIEDGKYETLQHNFPLNGLNGDYRLRLYVEPHPASPTSELTYYWDNAKGVHRNTANTTTDSVYIFDNNGEGYREEEIEVLFGDSLQNSDVGALKDGSNLTASWCRYNKSESETIIHLLGQQIINYNQSFKNSFSVEIIDLENIIKFGSVLLFKSKYYIFSNFKEDASENNKTGDLIQINNSEASVTESIQGLTSVDGESEGTGSGQIVQGSYWLPTAEGIYTNRNVAVGMAPTGTYDLEIAGDVDIGGTLSVAIDVTVGGTSVSLQGHTHVAADVTDLATWIENNIGLGELHNVALGSEALGMPLTYGGSSWAPARLQFEWIDPMYSASPSTNDVVKWSGSAWVVGSVPAYSHGFVGGHTDTPGTYSGSAGYLVMVNSTPDAVIFQPTTVLYSLSHDSFAGFVANEHINHTSVSIIAGTGLTGGGTIAASRTLNWAADLADLGDVTGTSTQWYFLGYNGAGAYTFYPARLDKLGDVTYSTPSQDYVVKYDSGSGWIIGSVPVGSHALTDHSDITISGAAEGDYLRKSAGDWQNYPLASVKGEINYWTLTGSDVYYSNKVGIGTTPHTTAFLHIQDVGFTLPSISSATKLIIEDSDYAYVSIMAPTAGALRFGDAASEQAGQIYYTHSNDEMKFKAGGSDMVYITTVGLGINGSPSYALDISAGYVQVDSGYGIGNWSDGANKSAIEFGDGTYGTNSACLSFIAGTSGAMRFYVNNGTYALSIGTSGNAYFQQDVDISGTLTTTGRVDMDNIFITGATSTPSSGEGMRIYYHSTSSESRFVSYEYSTPAWKNIVFAAQAYYWDVDGNADLMTLQDGGADHAVLALYDGASNTITLNAGGDSKIEGNLAVGAGTAYTTLDVTGTVRAVDMAVPTDGKGVEMFYNTSSDFGQIISYDRGVSSYKQLNIEGSNVIIYDGGTQVVEFATGATTWAAGQGVVFHDTVKIDTDYLQLYDDKPIYFGTTSGTDALIKYDSTGVELEINMRAEGNLAIQDDGVTKFTFDLSSTDSGIATALDWVAESDERLKTNFRPLEDLTNIIPELARNTIRWDWRKEISTRKNEVGWTAQFLKEIYPEAVTLNMAISPMRLLPPLYQGVAKNENRLNIHEQRIDYLKEKIKELEHENSEMRKEIELLKAS